MTPARKGGGVSAPFVTSQSVDFLQPMSQRPRWERKLSIIWDLQRQCGPSAVVHTAAVSLQLGAGVDRHFARGTVELLLFVALGLLPGLLLTSCWAPLGPAEWSCARGRRRPPLLRTSV